MTISPDQPLLHNVTIPDWAIKRGRQMNHFEQLDPTRTALIVIDMQSYFMAPGQPLANPYAMGIVPKVNRAAAALRALGVPIFWVRHTSARTGPGALPSWKMATPL